MKATRWWHYSTLVALVVVSLVAVILLPPKMVVQASSNIIDITLGNKLAYDGLITDGQKNTITIDGETTLVGKDVNTFTPDITMFRFGTEAWLQLGEPLVNGTPLMQKNSTCSVSDNVISWASKDLGFRFYESPTPDNVAKGLEYEITLANNKAGTNQALNTIVFPYQSTGLYFYYQPPLSDEWHVGDSFKGITVASVSDTQVVSENGTILVYTQPCVVGSYAVYFYKSNYEVGQTNYGTGKAFHIYRPLLIDGDGNTAWANIAINTEASTITLDFSQLKNWLNKAKYPVIIDPNFGYTSIPGNMSNYLSYGSHEAFVAELGNAPANATLGNAHWYWDSASGTHQAKTALYADDGSGKPSTRLTYDTNYTTWSGASLPDWVTSADTSGYSIVSGTPYWAACGAEDTNLYVGYDTSSGYDAYFCGSVTDPPSPWTDYTYDHQTNKVWGVYYDYTASATPAISNTPSSKAFGVLNPSSAYYFKGSAPSNPVQSGDCYFSVTNNTGGGQSVDLYIQATNWTGGAGWTNVSGSPGSNQVRETYYCVGDNPASGVVVTTSPQLLHSSLADSASIGWDGKVETGTWTDGVQKTQTVTISAQVP